MGKPKLSKFEKQTIHHTLKKLRDHLSQLSDYGSDNVPPTHERESFLNLQIRSNRIRFCDVLLETVK